jgi:predicted nucleic acid-binding protein
MSGDLGFVDTSVLVCAFDKIPSPKKQFARRLVAELAEGPLLLVDYSVIRAAVVLAGEARISFWDALIVVAASRSGAAVLYTEDLNDGQEILGVRISNPFAA